MRDVKDRYRTHPAKLPTGRDYLPTQKVPWWRESQESAYTSVHAHASWCSREISGKNIPSNFSISLSCSYMLQETNRWSGKTGSRVSKIRVCLCSSKVNSAIEPFSHGWGKNKNEFEAMPFLISGTPTFSKIECLLLHSALKMGLPRDPKFQAIPFRFQDPTEQLKENWWHQAGVSVSRLCPGGVLGLGQGHGHLSWCSHFFLPGSETLQGDPRSGSYFRGYFSSSLHS